MDSLSMEGGENMRRNEKGFTLIELLIVVIILGILAVIGIPKFMNSKQEAIVKACQTNRSSLEDAGERYFFDCGAYPGDGATASTSQDDLSATSSNTSGWNGPYIKADFTCPFDGQPTYIFDVGTGTVPGTGAVTCANVSSGNHAATYGTAASAAPSSSP
jgi:general secretion pathway protein G